MKEEFKNRMIKLPSCTIYYILSLHKIMDTLIKGEAMEHYNIPQNTPKVLTNKNNNENYFVNKLNISKQEITPNYENNNNYISENTNELF
ncbi:hypothetical protein [Leptotrichia wadei]|uniref:hypothetical protein n=1 Tax=Leptotrichia wadei TaxID=157687 RepID=UPI0028DCF721|nr:hypothetical protein [Leptotrichia wadei]